MCVSRCGSREEQGVRSPHPLSLANHKDIGFLSNTGPDPLGNHKATKLAFIVGQLLGDPLPLKAGHVRPISETPFLWCFAGEPLMDLH